MTEPPGKPLSPHTAIFCKYCLVPSPCFYVSLCLSFSFSALHSSFDPLNHLFLLSLFPPFISLLSAVHQNFRFLKVDHLCFIPENTQSWMLGHLINRLIQSSSTGIEKCWSSINNSSLMKGSICCFTNLANDISWVISHPFRCLPSPLVSRFHFFFFLTVVGILLSSEPISTLIFSIKEATCNVGDAEDTGSVPGLGRSPGGGNDNPLQYSYLKYPMHREAWWATVQRIAKSHTWLNRQHTIMLVIIIFHCLVQSNLKQ